MSNKLLEGKTMEEQEKFKAGKREAAKRYQENQKKAKETLKSFLSINPEGLPADVTEAIKYLTGVGKAERTSGPSVLNVLRQRFLDEGRISRIQIFEDYEYGKPAMNQKIMAFIKAKNPEDRIWVALEDHDYVLKGTGENPPEGWTGYMPVVKETL